VDGEGSVHQGFAMGYRLAVDLGTAFTAAAVVDEGRPTMVGLGNRTLQVPSALFFADDQTTVVGEAAERRGVADPARLVRELKRRFGDPTPLLVAGSAYSAESHGPPAALGDRNDGQQAG
jgi:molecular chaperone DnaK (HSP70)